jgi:hypothetical protein
VEDASCSQSHGVVDVVAQSFGQSAVHTGSRRHEARGTRLLVVGGGVVGWRKVIGRRKAVKGTLPTHRLDDHRYLRTGPLALGRLRARGICNG